MLDNVTEEQESWLSLSDVSVIFLVVYIVMKGVIFGGNLLTVVTICVDSALHTPAYIFTALLAAADLLVGLSGVYDILVLAAPSFLPLLSCPVNFLVIAAIVQAAQCTVLIALDRTLAIKYPLHYPLWMTNARAVAVVALSVVASLTYAAIMVNEMSWSPAVCDIWTNTETHDRILKELSPVVLFVPISGCLYLHILTIACRQRAAIAKMHRIRPLPVGPQQTLSWTEARLGRERAESTSAPARAQRPLTLLQEKENVRIHSHGSSTSTLLASTVNPAADLRASLPSAEQLGHGCVKDDAAPQQGRLSPVAGRLPFATNESGGGKLLVQEGRVVGVVLANVREKIGLSPIESLASSSLSSSSPCCLQDAALGVDKIKTTGTEKQTNYVGQSLIASCKRNSIRSSKNTNTSNNYRSKEKDTPVFTIRVAQRQCSYPAESAFCEVNASADVEPGAMSTINVGFGAADRYQFTATSETSSSVSLAPRIIEKKSLTSSDFYRGEQSQRRSTSDGSVCSASTVSVAHPAVSTHETRVLRSVAPGCGRDALSALSAAKCTKAAPTQGQSSLLTTTEIPTSSSYVIIGESRVKRGDDSSIGTRSSVQAVSAGAWKSCRMFFLVWGIYFLTIVPSVVFTLIILSSPVAREKTNFFIRLDGIFVYINSGINVFIYAWKDRRLRKSLWLVLKCRCNDI